MSLRWRQRLVDHLSHRSYEPSPTGVVADELRVDADQREEFDHAIDELLEQKKLVRDDRGRLRLPPMPDEVEGVIKVNPRGFGFIRTADKYADGDLFVPRGGLADAVSGDRVRAKVRRQPWRAKRPGMSSVVGRVEEILERGRSRFTGTLHKQGGVWLVEPDGRVLNDAVIIRDPHSKNAKEGDKVVIELLQYPGDDMHAEGVITRVLGDAGKPDVETEAVIAAHGLRTEFPEEVDADAIDAARRFDEETEALDAPDPEEREDLRDTFIFTIDPMDSKDFDDAISITHDDEEGTWELGVHIADVAHFVRPGEAMDVEARERGNSTYLPRLVLPMLPEVLSNGVCSLQEGVPRFAKSAFVTFDRRGRVRGQRFARTLIQSAKRLTYQEAQALIDGDEKTARQFARTEPVYLDELKDQLRRADKLARILRRRRMRDGMMTLDLPDVELVFDDDGHVVDAVPEDDAFTHTIIEMFMVEANEAVARLFAQLDIPILRRTHPEPSFGDLEELRMFARASGLFLPDRPDRHDLQELLEASRGKSSSRTIHLSVLRTFTKATYSPALVGHFALASDHYAHFTSPIRRYPDLVVHRALEAYLDRTKNGRKVPGGRKLRSLGPDLAADDRTYSEDDLVTLGNHCSDTELNSEEAERELRTFLVLSHLQEKHVGDVLDGVISGVTANAVFVSIERYLVEGMVRHTDLPSSSGRPDRWKADPMTGRLVAGRSGASIGLGDPVPVKIVSVDPPGRHLELAITELPKRPDGEIRRAHPGGGRGKGKGKGKGGPRSGPHGKGGRGRGKGKGKGKGKGR